MNLKKVIVLFGLVLFLVATAQFVLAEEMAVTSGDPVVIASNQQAALPNEGDMQWAWGEVTNLDDQAGSITLKYLDYETDQEKELVLVVDEKTTFENIQDFNELKLKDTLSIDYIIGTENKNIAKNISFERLDEPSSAPIPAVENNQPVTDAAQPVASLEAPASNLAQPIAQPIVPPSEVKEAPVEPASAAQSQAQ